MVGLLVKYREHTLFYYSRFRLNKYILMLGIRRDSKSSGLWPFLFWAKGCLSEFYCADSDFYYFFFALPIYYEIMLYSSQPRSRISYPRLYYSKRRTLKEQQRYIPDTRPLNCTEPVFVDLLRRPGIDSQPGGAVRNPICRTGPPGYIGWRNRFLGIDSWAP